ncbi:MAG: hypothetical protein LBU22_02795 [Dysgonamonadaceae bacterium]|jgi:hypothetical protein|nr:hypothetical protein [Dysgonamonadaceae bacterium]
MMKKSFEAVFCLLTVSALFYACHQEQFVPVEVDFSYATGTASSTPPLVVTLKNNSQNADAYQWTFEGGEPSVSNLKNPESVTFTTPGEHKITLEAWSLNDRKTKTVVVRVDSIVRLDFKAEVVINNYASATFDITNLSSGGIFYKWIFESGEPAVYEGKNPPPVTYTQEGKYSIFLLSNNGATDFMASRDIEVKEPLDASFSILPSFEDIDDMEAPLRASFETSLQGVESLEWKCEGAEITGADSPDASILFSKEGDYTVYLYVSNGKQQKQLSQNISIKANSNLRTHPNIRLGINTAQETIGSVYSTRLRQVFKRSEIDARNGMLIDIAFLGLNANYIYNLFVSPDNLPDTPLAAIPGAQATRFINKLEMGEVVQLTVEQFKSMTTDSYLKDLPVASVSYGNEFFTDSLLPRVVLFETSDGRKGAILIKEMIKNGNEHSYILVDIKVQKND